MASEESKSSCDDIFSDDFDVLKKKKEELEKICKKLGITYINMKQAKKDITEYIDLKNSQTENLKEETIFKNVKDRLIPLILKWHILMRLPLLGECFEDILDQGFNNAGIKTDWKPNRSHQIGKDMELYNYKKSKISCKSGIIKNNILKISGSRTSKQKTLKEKIHHLCIDRENWYFCLAKEKPFNNKYLLCIFKSELIKESIKNIDSWSLETYENGSFKKALCLCVKKIKSRLLTKSTSNQFWCEIPLEVIDYKYPINILNTN